jgi:hypothetical protein
MLQALECVVQSQAEVSDEHRLVGILERLGRRGVLSCRVPVGARGPRGVNSTLGLIHFLVRWRATTGNDEQQDEADSAESRSSKHRKQRVYRR